MDNVTTMPAAVEQPTEQPLTRTEIVAAATNSPALSDTSFTFGEREFKLLHLDYDSYLLFMAYLQPMLEGIAGKFAKSQGISLPGLELPELDGATATSALMKFCKKDLPEMCCVVCNQQAIKEKTPETMVDPQWVKDHAADPFELIGIVFKQINKNQMISRFAAFFAQILPMILSVTEQTKPTA
jgi:hypothetical protein